MKITLYELLGLVKDGKAPEKIKYNDKIFDYYNSNDYRFWDEEYECYGYLTSYIGNNSLNILNDEIEILEEQKKIPEKLTDILRVDDLIPPVDENMYKIWTQTIKNQNKINEIITYLENKGE